MLLSSMALALAGTEAQAFIEHFLATKSTCMFMDSSRMQLLSRTARALFCPTASADLESASEGVNTLLLGQRGIGKTLLMRALVDAAVCYRSPTARGPIYALFIDCSTAIRALRCDSDSLAAWLSGQLATQGFPPYSPSPARQDTSSSSAACSAADGDEHASVTTRASSAGAAALDTINAHLLAAGATLLLAVDEMDMLYSCPAPEATELLGFLLAANNRAAGRTQDPRAQRVRFILGSFKAAAMGLCFQALPGSPEAWTDRFPGYGRLSHGDSDGTVAAFRFDPRACVPLTLEPPDTFEEFCNNALQGVLRGMGDGPGEGQLMFEPEARGDSESESGIGGPRDPEPEAGGATGRGTGGSALVASGSSRGSSSWDLEPDGTNFNVGHHDSDGRGWHHLHLSTAFVKQLYFNYRGQVPTLGDSLRHVVHYNLLASVDMDTLAVPAFEALGDRVSFVVPSLVSRHFQALWRAAPDEYRALVSTWTMAASASASASSPRASHGPHPLFCHSLAAHARALGVRCDAAFIQDVYAMCDQDVLALRLLPSRAAVGAGESGGEPAGSDSPPGSGTGSPWTGWAAAAHSGSGAHAATVAALASGDTARVDPESIAVGFLQVTDVMHACMLCPRPPGGLLGVEVEALAAPAPGTCSVFHEAVVLESLATAPIQELDGVRFTYLRNWTSACYELHRPAQWTGELLHLRCKTGGVDAVAVTHTDTRAVVYLFQVLMPARRENQAQQWLRQPAMERAAARLRASRDAAAILETVQCGPVASVQPVLVLVTGYTVSPSARQEASAQGIVVLDLPVLQPYWAPRLQHCTSPLLDHLKPRAVGAPAAAGAS